MEIRKSPLERKYYAWLLFILPFFYLSACKKSNPIIPSTNTVTKSNAPFTNIYIGGFERNNSPYYAAEYWLNGNAYKLSVSNANNYLLDLAISGTEVYGAGYQNDLSGAFTLAKYWSNGQGILLGNPNQNSAAFAICLSGSDIYVTGQSFSSAGIPEAILWKNGLSTLLSNSTLGSSGNAITHIGEEIFIGGNNGNHMGYWNRDQFFPINENPFGNSYGSYQNINAIQIQGNNIYLGGVTDTLPGQEKAAYWKNGNINLLPDSSVNSGVLCMVHSGSDVYAGGYRFNANHVFQACYWKNGQLVSLTNGTFESMVIGMAVDGSDVYAVGYELNSNEIGIAKYWKNGQEYPLTDGLHDAKATCIVITKN